MIITPGRSRLISAGVLLGTLGFAASGCAGESATDPRSQGSPTSGPGRVVDGPQFGSVEEVAAAAQLYVRGVIGGVQSRELDGGGAQPETESNGVRVQFISISVTDSSSPELVAPGSSVPVVWDDSSAEIQTEGEDVSALVPGTEVLLIAKWKTSAEHAPGIDSVEAFLAPVGGEDGVFEIDGDTAQARGATVRALTPAGAKSKGRLTAPIGEIIRVARSAWR